jgi:hypothetical protein
MGTDELAYMLYIVFFSMCLAVLAACDAGFLLGYTLYG